MKFRLYYVPDYLAVIKARNLKSASLAVKNVFHTDTCKIRKLRINDLLLNNSVVIDVSKKALKEIDNELSKV